MVLSDEWRQRVSVRQRLAASLGANVYSYITTIIVQIALVAILLRAWGPTLYGEWLIVSTIPSYLSVSDLGLGTVVGNEMTLSSGRGDKVATNTAFQSVAVAILALGLIGLLPLTFALAQVPLGNLLGLSLIVGGGLSSLIALLIFQVWLNQIQTLFQAGFRSNGLYAFGTTLANTLRLVESLSLAFAAMMGSSPLIGALLMTLMRALGTLLIGIKMHRQVSWLRFGVSEFNFGILRSMIKPSVFFLAFPVANALNMQTPLLFVGTYFGADQAALFSTTRTLTRAVQQLMNIINSSVWPEMSRAFGEGKTLLLIRLNRTAVKMSFWACICCVAVLSFSGQLIYETWIHRSIQFDRVLFDLLLSVMLVNSFWYTASVVLAATNRHAGLATIYLLANAFLPGSCWVLTQRFGMNGVGIALLISEMVTSVYVLRASLRSVNDTSVEFFGFLLNPFVLK
jgi:O-antigen/teichoic acid export membrane protein